MLDDATGTVARTMALTALDAHQSAAFLSDDRIVVVSKGGLAVLDLGL